MRKRIFITILVLAGIIAFFGARYSYGQPPKKPGIGPAIPKVPGKCCISGTYKGTRADIPSATCKKPEKGKFIMHINQDKRCGSRIWGEVIDPEEGTTQKLEGTVTPGRRGCCNIKGDVRKPGEVTKFRGTLCMKGGKWNGKGEYSWSGGCNGTFKMVQTQKPKPDRPTITGYKEKCGRKGRNITILGRNFGSRAGKGVALGGHGIHVDFNVVSWSDTKIVAKIPDDPKIKEGQWYYIGVEKADHTQWLSNINKNITICSVQMKPKKMKVKPKISKAYIRGYIDGCMDLGHTYEECAERSKIIPRRMTKPRLAPMAMEPTPILSQFFYGCHAACRDAGKSTEECNKQCRGLEEEQKEQEEQEEQKEP